MLKLTQIIAGYGPAQVLHGVSLDVPRGRVTALLGANGAGKTTLMRVLAGLIHPESGSVHHDGQEITSTLAPQRVGMGIAMSPEGRMVFPTLSVEENLQLGAIHPRARTDYRERRDEMYALFPRLAERRRQVAGSMSGGEQQMLAIARALMARPDILLLDEPTLGLAPVMVKLIFNVVQRLKESGLTMLIAEQNVRQTLEIADHAYVLESGRIELQGSGADLMNDAGVRRAYLGM
ncbi:ABC transporter ATP-binding protein [Paraburkholderia sediminicola]|jgi:branched-chain amino acid transport system ATP-binding protein|uniref:ABC transporter ATP-binding protein n=1 Tax=Paraburkholderia sediminicola TaxID=458836 RepID=UPI0038B84D9C